MDWNSEGRGGGREIGRGGGREIGRGGERKRESEEGEREEEKEGGLILVNPIDGFCFSLWCLWVYVFTVFF